MSEYIHTTKYFFSQDIVQIIDFMSFTTESVKSLLATSIVSDDQIMKLSVKGEYNYLIDVNY